MDVTSWEIAHRTLHGGSAEHERPHEVPPGYGEDRIALLVRDPWCVFAFWEVTEAGWREAVGRLPPAGGHPRLVLRLFDVTGHVRPGQSAWSWSGNNGHTDVVVDGADHWYIHLERPGRAVAAEIGPARAQAFVPI
ncbi:MAG: DUF4912 domain-containing protein, partial [Firmicutes bacterium]|nr:DUF4912 domain-containing protein [Bacillota bacterium]